ncbi:MAG: hypothetical protein J6V53_03105 [Alphaproteobacteria bacterium]|nr:hypothetical protein [Alphaproteobacteria bacterium]
MTALAGPELTRGEQFIANNPNALTIFKATLYGWFFLWGALGDEDPEGSAKRGGQRSPNEESLFFLYEKKASRGFMK